MQNEADHEAGLRAKEAMTYIKPDERWLWADWMKVGEGLLRCRWEAMTLAGTKEPRGKGYCTFMSALRNEYGLTGLKETTSGALLNIMEHREEVEKWRGRQPNPASLNNPDHVWRGFQRSAYMQDRRDAIRSFGFSEAMDAARAHIEELEAANERQREEIERLQDGLEAERKRSAKLERLIERQRAEIGRLRMERRLTRSYRSKTG